MRFIAMAVSAALSLFGVLRLFGGRRKPPFEGDMPIGIYGDPGGYQLHGTARAVATPSGFELRCDLPAGKGVFSPDERAPEGFSDKRPIHVQFVFGGGAPVEGTFRYARSPDGDMWVCDLPDTHGIIDKTRPVKITDIDGRVVNGEARRMPLPDVGNALEVFLPAGYAIRAVHEFTGGYADDKGRICANPPRPPASLFYKVRRNRPQSRGKDTGKRRFGVRIVDFDGKIMFFQSMPHCDTPDEALALAARTGLLPAPGWVMPDFAALQGDGDAEAQA